MVPAALTKLAKLQRIKARKFRTHSPRLPHWLTLYWRQWHRVHGTHRLLWRE